jgi:hypothetical protein
MVFWDNGVVDGGPPGFAFWTGGPGKGGMSMSGDLAGMDGILGLLSDRTRRQIADAEARERAQSARDAEVAEVWREAVHQQALRVYVEMAQGRGEDLSAADIAMGRVSGRSIQEILAAAVAAAAEQDRAEVYRGSRQSAELVHVNVAEPVLHEPVAARSGIRLALHNRMRHFADRREAQRRADAAGQRLHDGDYGLVGEAPAPRPRPEEIVDLTASHRSANEQVRVSYR